MCNANIERMEEKTFKHDHYKAEHDRLTKILAVKTMKSTQQNHKNLKVQSTFTMMWELHSLLYIL